MYDILVPKLVDVQDANMAWMPWLSEHEHRAMSCLGLLYSLKIAAQGSQKVLRIGPLGVVLCVISGDATLMRDLDDYTSAVNAMSTAPRVLVGSINPRAGTIHNSLSLLIHAFEFG